MSNDTNRTDAGIRSEHDKRNEVSAEEGPFWKRWEKYGNGKCVFLYRRLNGSRIEDVYLVQRKSACVLSVHGNGPRDYSACDCDGLTMYGDELSDDMPEFKWAADAMAHSRTKGLLSLAPPTALEQAQDRVQVLERENERLREACEVALERLEYLSAGTGIANEAKMKIRAALSGTEETGGVE